MKRRWILAAAAALAGCPEGANPVDSIKTQVEARQEAPVIIDTIEAEQRVKFYQAKHGENPPSLEALEASEGKLKRLPPGKAYRYDAETGKIEVVDIHR